MTCIFLLLKCSMNCIDQLPVQVKYKCTLILRCGFKTSDFCGFNTQTSPFNFFQSQFMKLSTLCVFKVNMILVLLVILVFSFLYQQLLVVMFLLLWNQNKTPTYCYVQGKKTNPKHHFIRIVVITYLFSSVTFISSLRSFYCFSYIFKNENYSNMLWSLFSRSFQSSRESRTHVDMILKIKQCDT